MKVYVVWYDNGEAYEDNFQCIDRIFATKAAACKYLDDRYEQVDTKIYDLSKGKSIDSTAWRVPKFICSMDNMDCTECPKYNEVMDEKTGFCCGEDEERFESSFYEHEQWMIQEWDVDG